ncbi:MAG TPA: glycosyltransferase [Jiangellaceae bacterium]|nr:glycosyltransferase [Jiangellaceae bacterium]
MKVLIWHVHGSWTTSLVQGNHEFLLPVVSDRGPDGRGRAQTWDWPPNAVEVPVAELGGAEFDVAVLQRPREVELMAAWTGRRAGTDVPAVYVEHNAPHGPAASTQHPLAGQELIPIVHVTHFNRLMWDNGVAAAEVIEHGVIDPGYRYTGERLVVAAVVNEPVRRWRVAGTDTLVDLSNQVPVEVFGMGMAPLVERAPRLAGVHENLRQDALHEALGRCRAYFHPYRWTSLGLALIEAMMIGLPVLAWAATAAPDAVPEGAGVLSTDPAELAAGARRWLHDPEEARQVGLSAREHALTRFSLDRFLGDWDRLLKEVVR